MTAIPRKSPSRFPSVPFVAHPVNRFIALFGPKATFSRTYLPEFLEGRNPNGIRELFGRSEDEEGLDNSEDAENGMSHPHQLSGISSC